MKCILLVNALVGSMQYSDEYINSLLQELEKHYGKEFKERVLNLLNKQPQYIYFWELSGKTFGAIRCCFESRIVTRKEFLRYIISQDFNGKKEQAILHLGKISRDPLSKFLGKNVEILGVKAEYSYGIPLSKALREIDFLEKNGLIKKEGEKYIPTKEGLKVYEIIKQGV